MAVFPLALTPYDERKLGRSMVVSVAFVFVANLSLIIALNIGRLRRSLYLRKLKKKQQEAMVEREARRKLKDELSKTKLPDHLIEEIKEEPNEESSDEEGNAIRI